MILPDHVPQPSGGGGGSFFGIPCLTSTFAIKWHKTQCRLVGLLFPVIEMVKDLMCIAMME